MQSQKWDGVFFIKTNMINCPTSITDEQYKSIKIFLEPKEWKRKFSLRYILMLFYTL